VAKDIDSLRRSLEPYKAHQDELLRVIREHGGHLTQQEFDEEFADFKEEYRDWTLDEVASGKTRGRGQVIHTMSPRHFANFGIGKIEPSMALLGDPSGSGWSMWLDLLQRMWRLRLIRVRGSAPNIVYEIVEEEAANG